MTAPTTFRIDFVSDVACPWCAIGLAGLRQALARLDGEIVADIHLQPFELSPQMSAEGEDAAEHLRHKYNIGEDQLEANRKAIRERAAALGVTIRHDPGTRVYNTFDAHRLLHWADEQDNARALELKQALFRAYFDSNDNVADHSVLIRLAGEAGLDTEAAARVLATDEYAPEVRELEQHWQQAGIHSVPATIVNGKQLIPGGQPPEVFERALREIAAQG
ncbi:MAG TPA: DsbA family oxidoreductase [Rhodanobacteraceae bacterium]